MSIDYVFWFPIIDFLYRCRYFRELAKLQQIHSSLRKFILNNAQCFELLRFFKLLYHQKSHKSDYKRFLINESNNSHPNYHIQNNDIFYYKCDIISSLTWSLWHQKFVTFPNALNFYTKIISCLPLNIFLINFVGFIFIL